MTVLTVGQDRRVTYWDIRAPAALRDIPNAHDWWVAGGGQGRSRDLPNMGKGREGKEG